MPVNTEDTMVLHSPEHLQEILSDIEDLPSIPETLIEILKVLDDPDSGPSDLAEVVRLDAPLMAKVLRLANSPYYSSRGDIADINRCVAVLGYRTVRQVAICVSVATNLVGAVSRSEGQMDYRELWRHSVVTAAIAKHLAQMVGYPDPEEVFTAGLLHDVGKFILEMHDPESYAKVFMERADKRLPLVEVEEETFGFSHDVMGQAFAESWRFPEIMRKVFGEHHTSKTVGAAHERADLALALVQLADYLANTVEPPRCDLGFDPRHTNSTALHECANLTVTLVEKNLADIRESVQLASAFLDLS